MQYPLDMLFQQLYWAWRNWNLRPEAEEEQWHAIVYHMAREIEEILFKKPL